METIVYRLAVMRERTARIAAELTRAHTHLIELDAEIRKLAADVMPRPQEETAA